MKITFLWQLEDFLVKFRDYSRHRIISDCISPRFLDVRALPCHEVGQWHPDSLPSSMFPMPLLFVSGNYDLQCPDKVSTCSLAIPAAEAIFHRTDSAAASLELSQHRPTVSGYRTIRKNCFRPLRGGLVSIPRCNSINET